MNDMIPAYVEGALVAVDKLRVHQLGLRHPAVSVFVMAGAQTLLQRRALGKYHTPGLWTNSCCTHPRWGEDPAACAKRRLREELGLAGLVLRHAGQTAYRADVGGGLIEDELVDLFVAEMTPEAQLQANPEEVMQVRWLSLSDLADEIAAEPDRFTPWLRIYLAEGWGKVAQRLTATHP